MAHRGKHKSVARNTLVPDIFEKTRTGTKMKILLLLLILLFISLSTSTNGPNIDTTTGIITLPTVTVDNGIASLGCTVKTKSGKRLGILVCRA